MAATDIRGDLGEWIVSDPCSTVKHLQAIFDCTAEDSGVLTVATHVLMNIPTGHAIVGATIVPLTANASATNNSTVQWAFYDGSTQVTFTGATSEAGNAPGLITQMSRNALTATTGTLGYVAAGGTKIYLQFIVGTAALTAGKWFIDIALIDIDSNL